MKSLNGFKGKKICVAVSGGVDSTALMHYLKAQEKEYGYFLSAVHCEHGIRGEESLADQKFVEELCRNWEIPLFIFSCDCPKKAATEKMSLETAAREFRKECFAALIRENKADYIATAHHLLDEAETVLFRLARGSALSGAKGMKELDGEFIRPFLSWSKEKILAYANEHGLSYKVDKTNFERDATRNKLRLDVFPALEEAVSGAAENLARFACLAAEDDELLYELSAQLLIFGKDCVTVQFSEKKPLFTRACLTAMKSLCALRDYTSVHLEAAFALQKAERGAMLDFPQNIIARKTQTGICFCLKAQNQPPVEKPSGCALFTEKGFDGGRYAVNISHQEPKGDQTDFNILKVDGDKLSKNAVFRFRREGDFIVSFGGRKSLKKFFNEKKIPVEERAFLPLIADERGGEVYVICGVEISQSVKVTTATANVLYITLQK